MMRKWVIEKPSASHGQDQQAAEDGREVPAGCGQDKQGDRRC